MVSRKKSVAGKINKIKKNQKTPQLTGEMVKGSVHSLTLSVSTLLSCK